METVLGFFLLMLALFIGPIVGIKVFSETSNSWLAWGMGVAAFALAVWLFNQSGLKGGSESSGDYQGRDNCYSRWDC